MCSDGIAPLKSPTPSLLTDAGKRSTLTASLTFAILYSPSQSIKGIGITDHALPSLIISFDTANNVVKNH